MLATAANVITREAPAELTDLRKRFGCSTLKGVLLATELFDVTDEPTPGGGTRTIYRINERYELSRKPMMFSILWCSQSMKVLLTASTSKLG